MHSGHRQRLRDRYLREGLDSFELHNQLELLLFYAIPRKDTNEIAHRLVERYHSLSAILEAPEDELCTIEGIGPSAASFLHFIPQICRCYMSDVLHPQDHIIHSVEEAGQYLTARLIGFDHEVVVLLLLSSAGKIRFCDIVAHGNINSSDVDFRKLLALCAKHKAAKAIIAHNHPNGMALPSSDDVETTKQLSHVFSVSGTTLVDHIIVADGDYMSLAETGMLSGVENAK